MGVFHQRDNSGDLHPSPPALGGSADWGWGGAVFQVHSMGKPLFPTGVAEFHAMIYE